MTTASPPPPQELVSASKISRVSPKTVNNAVKSLLTWRSEKSKTEKPQLLEEDEFVYLIVTLKKIPQTSRTKPHRIPVPHPLIDTAADSPELCLIIDDRPKSGLTKEDATKKIKSENLPITKVLKLSKLKTDYKAYEAKRKLCDSYDMFFADRRVIPLLPRLIGKKFFATKKIPMAIDLKHKNWSEQIDKTCGSAMFFMRTGTCSVVKVGKLSMESHEIVDNVMATLNGVVEILPNQWKYVRSLHMKLSESLALPIYQAVPDLKLKIDAFESEKSVAKEDKKKKGKSDAVVAAVDDSESGEKSVAVQGKKKKGRIHEVRYMDSNVTEVLDEDEIGDVEEKNEIVASGDKGKKKRKKVSGVTESEKPAKKVAKGKLKEKEITDVAESEKPVKKAAGKGKLKENKVREVTESEKPVKKVAKAKLEEKKSKDGPKVLKKKMPKEESGGGLKPKRKKSVVRN